MAQVQVKQHQVRNKRDYNEITDNNDKSSEPKRKRQRIDNNNNNNHQKWSCKECTLENEATAKRCAVCNIPRNYKPKMDEFEDDDDDENEYIDDENDALFESTNNNKNKNKNKSWEDDEDDIDLDNYDGQQILSINNKDVANRINGGHSNKSMTSPSLSITPSISSSSTTTTTTKRTRTTKKESTLNGLEYTECWLCNNCFAMNRLLDTLSRYQLKCAFCNGATYTPTTQIIKSFEWDQQQQQLTPVAQSLPIGGSRGGVYAPRQQDNKNNMSQQASMLAEFERKKNRKYRTKHIENEEGDILISGMINQNKVTKLSTIGIIPQQVIKLCLLFMDEEFNHDVFDTLTNSQDFQVSAGLTKATRTTKDDGQWRNCFGMKKCEMKPDIDGNTQSVKYQWTLKCNKRRNKDWEDEPVESVIIGVIESKGIQPNMGTSFTSYNDGWGLLGDGQKVTDGNYEKFNAGFHHGMPINITLQYIKHPWNDKLNIAQLLFNNKLAYDLDANKRYKIAVAMKNREYEVEWISFNKSNEIQSVSPIQTTKK